MGQSWPVHLEQAVALRRCERLLRYGIGQGAQVNGGDGDDRDAGGVGSVQGVGVGVGSGEADVEAGGRSRVQADSGQRERNSRTWRVNVRPGVQCDQGM